MNCPNCDNKVDVKEGGFPECDSCGCFANLNPVNGNLQWMLNGRVIKSEKDEEEAENQMENAYGYNIRKGRVPDEMRDKVKNKDKKYLKD